MTKEWENGPQWIGGFGKPRPQITVPPAGRAYAQLVASAAAIHGLPEVLIWAIMAQESGFNPKAFRAEPKIHDGSHGLMQLLLKTARGLGYQGEEGEASKLTGLYDPATNIALGAKLLKQNLDRAGSIEGAISAYNGGFRPELGFGKRTEKHLTVCLARDQKTGACLRYREVPKGSFSNSPYVEAVIARIQVYTGDFGPRAA